MIRQIERNDYEQWLPLWQENCQHKISDDVTAETWRRLTNPKENVFGLGMFYEGETLQGFLHTCFTRQRDILNPACYMQDLFIDPQYRRQGIARRLVWELNEIGKQEKWARIYWFAKNSDEAVQALYKNLGIPMDFTLFMLPTQGT